MNAFRSYLGERSKTGLLALGLLTLCLLGWLDYITGADVAFSLFYLILVGLVTWLAGRTHGWIFGMASAVVGVLADLMGPGDRPDASILFWNAASSLAVFLGVAHLLDLLRTRTANRVSPEAASLDARIGFDGLGGLVPICSSCKNIRDARGRWNAIESYIQEHSELEFTHGICPDCAARLYPNLRRKEG